MHAHLSFEETFFSDLDFPLVSHSLLPGLVHTFTPYSLGFAGGDGCPVKDGMVTHEEEELQCCTCVHDQ
jgi:hypothetical protein